jgi:hydroxymethylbilane synthase
VLAALGGGCQVPIGAYATVAEGRLRLLAIVASPDGTELVRAESEGPVSEAAALGRAMGAELLERGARRILDAVYAG